MKCTKCGRDLAENALFCPGCGQKREPEPKCGNCGETLQKGSAFCAACGARQMPNTFCRFCGAEKMPLEQYCPNCKRDNNGNQKGINPFTGGGGAQTPKPLPLKKIAVAAVSLLFVILLLCNWFHVEALSYFSTKSDFSVFQLNKTITQIQNFTSGFGMSNSGIGGLKFLGVILVIAFVANIVLYCVAVYFAFMVPVRFQKMFTLALYVSMALFLVMLLAVILINEKAGFDMASLTAAPVLLLIGALAMRIFGMRYLEQLESLPAMARYNQ